MSETYWFGENAVSVSDDAIDRKMLDRLSAKSEKDRERQQVLAT